MLKVMHASEISAAQSYRPQKASRTHLFSRFHFQHQTKPNVNSLHPFCSLCHGKPIIQDIRKFPECYLASSRGDHIRPITEVAMQFPVHRVSVNVCTSASNLIKQSNSSYRVETRPSRNCMSCEACAQSLPHPMHE